MASIVTSDATPSQASAVATAQAINDSVMLAISATFRPTELDFSLRAQSVASQAISLELDQILLQSTSTIPTGQAPGTSDTAQLLHDAAMLALATEFGPAELTVRLRAQSATSGAVSTTIDQILQIPSHGAASTIQAPSMASTQAANLMTSSAHGAQAANHTHGANNTQDTVDSVPANDDQVAVKTEVKTEDELEL